MDTLNRIGKAVLTAGNMLRPSIAVSGDPLVAEPYHCLRDMQLGGVIDAGAHVGEFALMIREVLPGIPVVSFEPNPIAFAALKANAEDTADWTCLPYALDDHHGDAVLHANAFTPSSSLLPISRQGVRAFPYAVQSRRVSVPVRSLDALWPLYNLRAPLLLKLDVQGYEDRVLRGASAVLEHVSAIVIEVSYELMYKGQMLYPEIVALLGSLGFTEKKTMLVMNDVLGRRPVQADLLFVRTSAC